MPDTGNLYDCPAAAPGSEAFSTLHSGGGIRIERIVSNTHPSPPGFWYDQPGAEWVAVLKGEATLAFASGELLELRAGDWVSIPPHAKHRVERTGADTIWLAVHTAG